MLMEDHFIELTDVTKIYIVGGAVIIVGAIIPLMLIILVKHLKKYSQD